MAMPTGAIMAFAVLWLSGCGAREAHVSGRVTLDDVPVPGGQVVFMSEDEAGAGPFVAHTDDRGNYKLKGNTGSGIPTGKYKVVVTKMVAADGRVPTGENVEATLESGTLKNLMPPFYEDRSTTLLEVDVGSGSRTINLELKRNP